jgi:hypothetical protein
MGHGKQTDMVEFVVEILRRIGPKLGRGEVEER